MLARARRAGEHDTLYGSVTAADIAEDLAAKGFAVDKRKIQLDEPIKKVGEFTVPVKLYRGVVAQLRLRVSPLGRPQKGREGPVVVSGSVKPQRLFDGGVFVPRRHGGLRRRFGRGDGRRWLLRRA